MFNKLSIFLIFVSLFLLTPLLVRESVDYGQLGKQTFAAEMIKSTASGELVQGIFPIRHFLEPNHDSLIPWAEEFPIYSVISSKIEKISHLSPEQSGKALSFFAFLLLILGFYSLSNSLTFALIASLFPAFRLYSVEVMPDLMMTALCVWAIAFTKKGDAPRAALFIGLASLFKYYAVFTGFGIGIYYLIQLFKTKDKKFILNSFLLALSVLPCIGYIYYFIHLGIPNPITEYRANDGHGHLASIASILSFQKWLRIATWLWVKNSTVLGSALAFLGFYSWIKDKNRSREDTYLFGALWFSWILFSVVFIDSFYVHDYYGLQGSIGTAIFAALGLSSIHIRSRKSAIFLSFLFLIWSNIHVNGMAKPLAIIEQMKQKFAEVSAADKPEYVMSISGISKPLAIYHLNLKGWVAASDEFFTPVAQVRMKDSRINGVMILNYRGDDSLERIKTNIALLGFNRLRLRLQSEHEEFYWYSK